MIVRVPSGGDIGRPEQLHGALCAQDGAFDMAFQTRVAEILVSLVWTRNPAMFRRRIAEQDSQRRGSTFRVEKSG